MSSKVVCAAFAAAVLALAGCDSGESEAEHEGESANAPAAQTVRDFYDAANRSAGKDACGLLTENGIRTVVRAPSRAACVSTIDSLDKGSFEAKEGELLDIEGVDESGEDGFDVDAALKGRSGGTFHVVKRDGRLLIDGFEPEEG
jgi:hypothetical protein